MPPRTEAYRVFYQWLILQGLLIFAAAILWSLGLFTALLETDRSYLSGCILLIFVGASARAGWRARSLSRELEHAQDLHEKSRHSHPLIRIGNGGEVAVGGRDAATSLAHEHLGFLATRASTSAAAPEPELLLERLAQRVRRGQEGGWFTADLMLKLGLLGTVIGFILMLGSIDDMSQIDVQAVQLVLTDMSSGMRVALYTTLTGLSAGILLGIQNQLLDRAADDLLAQIIEISEVHLPRHLLLLAETAD